jgi:hypothetical protein
MPEDEPRYTVRQIVDFYHAFMRDFHTKQRMKRDGIDHWEQTELLVRFLGYLRSCAGKPTRLNVVKQLPNKKKNLFNEPTDGTLFREP